VTISETSASTLVPASHREQARMSSKNAKSLQTRTIPVPLHSEHNIAVAPDDRALSFAARRRNWILKMGRVRGRFRGLFRNVLFAVL